MSQHPPQDTGDELFAVAVSYHQQGNLRAATDAYNRLLAVDPGHYRAKNNLALIAQDLSRLEIAERLFKQALDLAPDSVDVLLNLANLYLTLGRTVEAEARLRAAAELAPDEADIIQTLVKALIELGKTAEARELILDYLTRNPGTVELLYKLALIYSQKGNAQESVSYLRQAHAIDSSNLTVLNQLAEQSLLLGDLGGARQFLDTALSQEPANIQSLSLSAVLLNLAEDEAALTQLYRYEDFLTVSPIRLSDAYESPADFNESLLDYLEAHAVMQPDLSIKATVNGQQSVALKRDSAPVIEELYRLIEQAINDSMTKCRLIPDHPFATAIPERYSIEAWMVNLQSGGYQKSHVHFSGWLSGCYYPKLPEQISPSSGTREGWLEFGAPPDKFGIDRGFLGNFYCPRVGELVSFPSYYWHRTVPFVSTDSRVSIAFDVRPV